MSTRLCLITNNSTLRACTIGNSSIDFSIQLLEGSPFDVLMGGRDLIHQGWRLLNHPLYGNFRPGQQAMRSLLLSFDSEKNNKATAPHQTKAVQEYYDEDSLNYIEQALQIYEPFSKLLPTIDAEKTLKSKLLADCALIDKELMHVTLKTSGINVPLNHMEE